ncbi:murein L,D-transpeptidase catalytic domain family protein [Salinimicrobium sp. MT39]|uniref:Murein L,D-transpeptidase catalytic domain family protein n=1 Tax=Salinimicrobium profundisediminis TaxID=2994553 RepID=A0A9X3CYW0_9FLAO|nr:murein L,D-transpeptidase catalytic domain family protein [Salinimicrobium profundisediminis]MCX2838209.1 murein L,D-transpeptidase catalytic domain family protein [Salinimicrobium profundisediminis]
MINNTTVFALLLTISASFAFTTNSLNSEKVFAKKTSEKEVIEVKTELTAEEKINLLYEEFAAVNAQMPSKVSFTYAITGYNKLENEEKIENRLLSIVDFSLPSTEKRLWILDMETNEIIYHTYVSHGKNTGGNMATKFSNTPNSLQSSLGFYVTAETYYGKNGLSLFIDGMEEEFNSNARDRYVVIHGADYAQESSIKRLGRLGRSYGCPAVPTEVSKEIINKIKGGSALFIYHTNKDYISNSTYLNSQSV